MRIGIKKYNIFTIQIMEAFKLTIGWSQCINYHDNKNTLNLTRGRRGVQTNVRKRGKYSKMLELLAWYVISILQKYTERVGSIEYISLYQGLVKNKIKSEFIIDAKEKFRQE